MTEETKPVLTSEGQTFLVGPTLYVRGVEMDDAKYGTAWYPSHFPLPHDVLEERIKKEVAAYTDQTGSRVIVCRRSDNKPVGSFHYRMFSWFYADLSYYTHPGLSESEAAEIEAEMILLSVPYFQQERDVSAVWIETISGRLAVDQAIDDLGMRFGYRLREARLVRGVRRDLRGHMLYHPVWVARMGEPVTGVEGAVERDIRHPAPLAFPTLPVGEMPEKAMMVGERVFLRPFEKDDAVKDVLMLRRETETFFDDGRRIRSSIRAHQQHIKFAEEAYPEWIRFAICLRDTGELIGSNGIADIDYVHGIAETETMVTNPAYRNSGYGSEAKQLLLAYAFDQLGLHLIQSWVWGPNTRSAAALRKQGYRDAGQCSWTGAKNGEVTQDLVFDYLASEWRAARR